jgi:hypothetical protein
MYPVRCITSSRFGKNLFLFFAQHVHCCDHKFCESGADVQIEALSRRQSHFQSPRWVIFQNLLGFSIWLYVSVLRQTHPE